jgi:CheY-like chemotaxis protein
MTATPADGDPRQTITLEALREALECLYTSVALANSTLAESGLFVAPEVTVLERAQALRQHLLRAIEVLRPLRPMVSAGQSGQRSYEILTLRYVAGYTVPEVADQLSLGTRQVYRDLRRAEEELASLLIAQLPSGVPTTEVAHDGLQHEIDALVSAHQIADVVTALGDALSVLQPLIAEKRLVLDFRQEARAAWVPLASGVVREVMIQFLSAIIQQTSEHERMTLRVAHDASHVEIRASLSHHRPDPQQALFQQAMRTMRLLGSLLIVPEAQHGDLVLRFTTLAPQPVLVVEDNPGARVLYERYLEASRWRVVTVQRLSDIAETAVSLRPAAIVLDILMAEVDGWTLLQVLKTDPRVAQIPVIVCSVIDDPELARALGASASLVKPLSRSDLLEALERVTAGRSEA